MTSEHNAARVQQLQEWLAEWNLHQQLAATEREAFPAPAANRQEANRERHASSAADDYDLPVAAGQIRLMAPVSPATSRRPLYVAILEAQHAGFLMFPFSPFQTPATPGEWICRRNQAPLRVLCVWNALQVSSDTLERGWIVDALSSDEQQAVHHLYRALQQHAPVSRHHQARIGPPIHHPRDPRYQYLDQEREMMQQILSREPSSSSYPLTGHAADELPLAAESREPYDPDAEPED